MTIHPQPIRSIVVRRVKPAFDAAREPLWFERKWFQSDFYTAYTVLLADEHEFVRVLRHFLPTTTDEHLRKQLKGWLAQETTHGIQHTSALAVVDRMGLRYRLLLRVMRFVNYRVLARALGLRFMLAVVAGLEHFNTMLGEMALRESGYFRAADPQMGLLLTWHFGEEIEHRAVVHDVAIAHGIGYWTRIISGFVAFFLYSSNLFLVAWWFALQQGSVLRFRTYRSAFRFLFVDEKYCAYFFSYLRDYLSRQFHPNDRDTDEIANVALAQVAAANVDPPVPYPDSPVPA